MFSFLLSHAHKQKEVRKSNEIDGDILFYMIIIILKHSTSQTGLYVSIETLQGVLTGRDQQASPVPVDSTALPVRRPTTELAMKFAGSPACFAPLIV